MINTTTTVDMVFKAYGLICREITLAEKETPRNGKKIAKLITLLNEQKEIYYSLND